MLPEPFSPFLARPTWTADVFGLGSSRMPLGEFPKVLERGVELLIERLVEASHKPVDLSYWISMFSLDFMGGYSVSYHMLQV
jgi:hypothetical protein